MRRLLAGILAALMLLAPTAALGLSVSEVAEELKCPTCNSPLDVSNAPIAQRMKAQIATRISQGATKQEIIDEFVQEFGPAVRATPQKSGFDLIAWVLPAVAIALGLAAIPVVTRAWARKRAPAAEPPPTLSPEDQARVDGELEAFGDG